MSAGLGVRAGTMELGFAWYFLSFKGRISRQEFWLGQGLIIVLALLVVVKLTAYFLAVRQPANYDELGSTLALSFYFIEAALFWPVAAITVKRLHDLNLSGWWVLASLALCDVSAMINDCSLAFLFMTTVILAGLPSGTRGKNRFGADPLTPSLA